MVLPKQLFLSKQLVTEDRIFDGGVLVDENGVIEKVLTRDQSDQLISDSKEKITVKMCLNFYGFFQMSVFHSIVFCLI